MGKRKGWLVVPIIFVGIIIGFFWFHKFVINETAYMDHVCEMQLETSANENVFAIKAELLNALRDVSLVSARFESEEITLSNDTVRILRRLINNTTFTRIFLSDLNGECISNTGAIYDVSGRDFYQRAMFGESTIRLEENSEGQEHILVSVPVLNHGKIAAAVHGELDLYTLYKIMNTNSFDGQGYATLVNVSGDYIITSANERVLNKKSENIFAWLDNTTRHTNITTAELKQKMEANDTGIFTLSMGEDSRVLCYLPIEINDWYLFQQISEEYVDSLVSGTNRNVMILVVEVCSSILLSVLVVALYVKRQRRERESAIKRFITLADNIPGGVAELAISDGYTILYANDGFYALTGYTKEEFENTTHNGHDLIVHDQYDGVSLLQIVKSQIEKGNSVSVEYQIKKKNGEIHWLHTVGTIISRNQNGAILQAIITDITFQKEQTEWAIDRAKHDKMTQLYDKVSVGEIINELLIDKGKSPINVVTVLDIDNFKHINDTYGHQIGDIAIIAVANKLKEHFRNTDIIGRVGGDEFVVCMFNVPDDDFVESKLTSLLEKIKNIIIADQENLITCSAGSVILHAPIRADYDLAFKIADHNLYDVKKNHKGQYKITTLYSDDSDAVKEAQKR